MADLLRRKDSNMNSGWRRGVRRVLVGAAITSAVHCSASNPSATKTGDGGSTPADAGGGGEAGGGSGGACSGFSDDAGIIVCPTFGSLTPAQVSGEQSFCSSGSGTWVATCPSPAGTLGGVCTLGIAGNLISSVTYYSGARSPTQRVPVRAVRGRPRTRRPAMLPTLAGATRAWRRTAASSSWTATTTPRAPSSSSASTRVSRWGPPARRARARAAGRTTRPRRARSRCARRAVRHGVPVRPA